MIRYALLNTADYVVWTSSFQKLLKYVYFIEMYYVLFASLILCERDRETDRQTDMSPRTSGVAWSQNIDPYN